VNRSDMRILVIVGTERSENLRHRKGKGSFPMQIREGVVDPKRAPRWSVFAKGKLVNIPVLARLRYILTLLAKFTHAVKCANMYRPRK
jgi:hypothetical protein